VSSINVYFTPRTLKLPKITKVL